MATLGLGEKFRISITADPQYGPKPEVEVDFLNNDEAISSRLSNALIRRICGYWRLIPGAAIIPKGTGFVIQGFEDLILLTVNLPNSLFRYPELIDDSVLRLVFEILSAEFLMSPKAVIQAKKIGEEKDFGDLESQYE
jgi:hypothetical protein